MFRSHINKKHCLYILIVSLLMLVIHAGIIEAADAIIAYRSNTGSSTTSSPKIQFWNSANGGSWSGEIELATAGSPVREVRVRYSPVSAKIVLTSLSDDGNLDAYVCRSGCTDPNTWTVSNDIGNVWATAATQRRFDIEYETATGDLMVVFSVVNTSTDCDLLSITLPANKYSFSGIDGICIDDGSANGGGDLQYSWVNLDADPVASSEEIVLVGFDSTGSDTNAWIWSGSAWGNQQELTAAATATGGAEAQDGRYVADGSIAMVASGDSTVGNVAVYHWTGAGWTNTADFDVDTGDSLDVRSIRLLADPATDDIQAVFVDSGSDLGTAYWSGSSWAVTSNIDTAVDANAMMPADFAWNHTGSVGILVWDTDTTSSTLSNRTCSPSCTSATSTFSTFAGTGAWLDLFRNPTASDTVNFLGVRLNSAFDIGSFAVNDSGFANYGDGIITVDTTVTTFKASYLSYVKNTTLQPDDILPTAIIYDPSDANITEGIGTLNITFLSNATDDLELTNATLYHNLSGLWQANESVEVNGTFNETSFSLDVAPTTVFIWNVLYCDASNNCAFADQNFTITINEAAANAAPVVTAIDGPGGNSISPQSIIEDGITDLEVTFTATDDDGVGDLDFATLNLTLIMQDGLAGTDDQVNASCGNVANLSGTEMNITCAVELHYWFNATEWNLTAGIADFQGVAAENTTNFTLQETTAIVISANSLSFPPLTINDENTTSDSDPITINNTGNDNIDANNTLITGLDLVGEEIDTQAIATGNFTVGPDTGGTPPLECNATALVNATATNINSTIMYAGNRSISGAGVEDLYVCLTLVPPGLSPQAYSTLNSSVGWTISVV